jgi:gliding motility-associated-like protein
LLTYRFLADNGCSQSDSNTILVNPVPVLNAGEDRVLIRGNSLKLEPTISGTIQSTIWVPSTGLSDPQSFTPTASPLQSIYYALIATTTDGCLATDTLLIRVVEKIGIPNAFSPNGDGINDTWSLDGLWGFPKARLVVFDRYGQQVFSASGNQAAWDGTRQGKPVVAGTYYYTLFLNADYTTEPSKGSVTVIR